MHMRCAYPYTPSNGTTRPCGLCMPCRINKKRMWTGRMAAEALYSPMPSLFITLTYNPENIPIGATLAPRDLHKYIDRVRKTKLGHFRYFAVGEYGDKSERPHYHMIAFNTGHMPETIQIFEEHWKNGFSTVEKMEKGTAAAAYVANYCTKKMTKNMDSRLEGRYPEFTRQSRRPPIGAPFYNQLIDKLYTESGSYMLARNKDVPSTFRIDGKLYSIDPYWKKWLRSQIGITDPSDVIWGFEGDLLEDSKNVQTQKIEVQQARQWHEKLKRQKRTIRREI